MFERKQTLIEMLENSIPWAVNGMMVEIPVRRVREIIRYLREDDTRILSKMEVWPDDFVLERRTPAECVPVVFNLDKTSTNIAYFTDHHLNEYWAPWGQYNASWRCWVKEPTEEERKKAVWGDA